MSRLENRNWPTIPYNADMHNRAVEALEKVLDEIRGGRFGDVQMRNGQLALDTLRFMEMPLSG